MGPGAAARRGGLWYVGGNPRQRAMDNTKLDRRKGNVAFFLERELEPEQEQSVTCDSGAWFWRVDDILGWECTAPDD